MPIINNYDRYFINTNKLGYYIVSDTDDGGLRMMQLCDTTRVPFGSPCHPVYSEEATFFVERKN